MKCDTCDNEATVHEVSLKNGVRVEKHLCEACAAKLGMAAAGSTLGDLLTNFVLPQITGEAARPARAPKARPPVCPRCAFTFEQFRQAGLLGCPDCYTAFESLLVPLLERWHEGANQHVGKLPRRATESGAGKAMLADARALAEKRERLEKEKVLRRQLEDAVKSEQYELAARLRDQLQKLAAEVSKAGEPASDPTKSPR